MAAGCVAATLAAALAATGPAPVARAAAPHLDSAVTSLPDDVHWSADFPPPHLLSSTYADVAGVVSWRGRTVVGGSFDWIGGLHAPHLASFDGTRWEPIDLDLDGPVTALLVHEDRLIVAGWFTRAGGAPAAGIAAWDGDRVEPLGAGLGGAGGALPRVRRLIAFRGDLIAGGEFTHAGGLKASNIARWDGAAWHPLGAGVNDYGVYALAEFDGDLYAGGWFGLAGGEPAALIARWDGAAWHPLGAGTNGVVFDLEPFGGKLIVAGGFSRAGPDDDSPCIATWDGAAWGRMEGASPATVTHVEIFQGAPVASTWRGCGGAGGCIDRWDGAAWREFEPWQAIPLGDSPFGRYAPALFRCGDALLVAHNTSGFGQRDSLDPEWEALAVVTWDGDAWTSLVRGAGLPSPVGELATRGDVLVVPADDWGGAPSRTALVTWDGAAWTEHEAPWAGERGYFYQIVPYRSESAVGGRFRMALPDTVANLALWDGAGWSALPAGPLKGSVRALLADGDRLFAAGYTSVDDRSATVGLWDGAIWRVLGSAFYGRVHALAIFRGELIVAGFLRWTADGEEGRDIARWDGETWRPLGAGVSGGAGEVYVLAVAGDDLIAGGDFTSAGGKSVRHLARWDGAEWSAWGGGADAPVRCLRVLDSGVLAGGDFREIGGTPVRRVAVFRDDRWYPLGSGTDGPVYAAAELGGSLYLAGTFAFAGGRPSSGIARWVAEPSGEPTALLETSVARGEAGVEIAWRIPPGREHVGWHAWRALPGEAPRKLTAQPLTGRTGYALVDAQPPAGEAEYRLSEAARHGAVYWHTAGRVDATPDAAARLALSEPWPNPSATSTRVRYRNPSAGPVRLEVVDVRGRLVRALVNGDEPAGEAFADWDGADATGRDAGVGIYFFLLRTTAGSLTRRIVRLR